MVHNAHYHIKNTNLLLRDVFRVTIHWLRLDWCKHAEMHFSWDWYWWRGEEWWPWWCGWGSTSAWCHATLLPSPWPPSEWEYTMHIVIRHPGVAHLAHGYTGICNEPFLASQSDFEQRRRRFEFYICYPGSVIRKRPQMGLESLNV